MTTATPRNQSVFQNPAFVIPGPLRT